jgi:hypothetical protein
MTWGKQNSEAEAHEQLSFAFDNGVNFLDTVRKIRHFLTWCSLRPLCTRP